MKYNFDQVIDRTGTGSLKWQKYQGKNILPMWVADMDFQAPPAILQAIRDRVDHGIFGYTLIPEHLNQIIVKRMQLLYNWTIRPEWISWLPGVVSAMNAAGSAFGNPTRTIVTTTPIYPPFLEVPKNCGAQLVTVPMIDQNQRATLDFDTLETQFKQGVGLFMFCSPYNPCGTLFTRPELQQLVELCKTYDVVLCSDEIHADFVLDSHNHHIPTASISTDAQDRTITLMAPSKTYNIPGLGASFAIISNPDLRKRFQQRQNGLVPHVNLLGLVAAQAAYEHCDDWLKQLIVYLGINRDLVYTRVNQMKGCTLYPIESTYLAWIDVTQTKLKDPVNFFEQAGLGLSDGAFFGQKGFVRLNFGCPGSILEKGLDRMETALKQI
ncbi:MAG: PatB family C-S lyase [Pseudomonadota bacterium]